MTLTAGTRLGPYEVVAPLGAGGMGEVYRARDHRLERDVAIKVLPQPLAEDTAALSRFEREARAVAALSHPNILAIHDFGRSDGISYAVTELLEGETLRELLRGGPLPARRAVEYMAQAARGLAAAHERGIVHRDLKPENLFLTRDGHLKILDFGLAKQALEASSATHVAGAPTMTGTDPGVVMGTAGYMSPEQVRAQPVDHRSDIFALGAVLYEMVAGERAFKGDTAADTMSAVLREDPPALAASGRSLPPGLERIVRHCLEKRPEDRFQSARDLAFDLEALSTASTTAALPAPSPRLDRRRLGASVALILVGGALGALVAGRWRGLQQAPTGAEAPRLRFITSSGNDWAPSASPDGKLVAFSSDRDGKPGIWLRQMGNGTEAPLGAEQCALPRFSPDGESLLVSCVGEAGLSLQRIGVLGGEPRRLAEGVSDGDWSPDGRSLTFVRPPRQPVDSPALWVALADGSEARELTRITAPHARMPRWSPDGRSIAGIGVTSGSSGWQIWIADAATGVLRFLDPARPGPITALEWNGTGELLYSQVEAPTDLNRLVPANLYLHPVSGGAPRAILGLPRQVGGISILGEGRLVVDLDASREGLRELALGGAPAERRLTGGTASDRQPVYSPDGRRIVFASGATGSFDLYAIELESGTIHRLTDHPAEDWDPGFLRDGRLLWSSTRTGHFEIWTAEPDGSGPRQLSQDGYDAENPTSTPDGWVVFSSYRPDAPGLWIVRQDGSQAHRIWAGSLVHPETSPDGRYALFFVGSGPSTELRVIRLPGGEPVDFAIEGAALGGNNRGRWMPDGRAIVFLGRDAKGHVGIVEQDFAPGRDTRASRHPLGGFDSRLAVEIESFGISPDGRHLVVAEAEYGSSLLLAEGVPGIRARGAQPAPVSR